MSSKINHIAIIIFTVLITPTQAFSESNFSYDFYEIGASSTTSDDSSFTSLDASASMEINNDHYITGHIKSDIESDVTASEIGVGIGAYKSSSEDTDFYSRAGIKHGKVGDSSRQTLNVGFGARHQMSDTIELQGGIDLLFATVEDASGVTGNVTALYKFDENIQVGGTVTTDGDTAETRLFTRISTL